MRPAPPGRRETAHAGLLHNMSCRPSTQIRHVAAQQRAYGHKRVFQLPKDSGEVRPASGWLKELHCRYRKVRPQLAEAELRRLINDHVVTLDLPPAAAVLVTARPGDAVCGNLLTILTVLSKSSGRVYLRDKEPNLANLTPDRRVVLIIPPKRSES